MSRADPRYLEAWKRPSGSTPGSTTYAAVGPTPSSSSSRGNTKKKEQPATGTLNVRLDTPGGITYSPSELSTHNIVKRTFIPYKLGESSRPHGEEPQDVVRGAVLPNDVQSKAQAYDFGPDIVQGLQRKDLDVPQESEARRYALSIDLSTLSGRPEGGQAAADWAQLLDTNGNGASEAGDGEEAPSVLAPSHMTTASTRTNMTSTTLASARPDSSLPDWYTRTSAKAAVVPFIPPPRFTGRAVDAKQPWNAMRWHGHRALERPSRRDEERGIAAFEDVNGPGRVPSAPASDSSSTLAGDVASVNDAATIRDGTSSHLRVADLFVVDPRRTRPLRMVRRVDPGQVLLLCNGAYFHAKEVAAKRAAKAAQDAGLSAKDATTGGIKETQQLLDKLSLSSEPRGGIGVLFCPNDDPLNQDTEALQAIDPCFEANTSKRLEAPPDLVGVNSARRAQLRAVLAALELANWEEEGFDKIVIGVEQHWIVRGITTDIWRWRHTGWKLTEHSAQGGPGENVPDRDLWELIDDAVQKYEEIDCNVRFWQVSAGDAGLAKTLAEAGALKEVPQRQGIVRWRKKPAPVIAAANARKAEAEQKAKAKALDDAMHGRGTG